ncbi:MAG: ferredoxin:protochlorophyllide reductase (ATP-dependent) subunit N [Chitinispirillia bacterium]|jgi:light-independent protochlorophyllide reductase subunit N
MCITYENGDYFTFCPLGSIGWLSKRIPDSFYLVIGSLNCAYFLQSHNGFRMFEDMRFACAVFEESDINSTVSAASVKPFVEEIFAKNNPKLIFLMGSCICEILKIDMKKISQELSSQFNIPVIDIKISGFDSVWTQGEDAVLSGLIDLCPKDTETDKKKVLFLGSSSTEETDQLREEVENLGIPVEGFLPSYDLDNLPVVNHNTVIVPLQPFITNTLEKIKRTRKSSIITSQFPFGPDGSRNFFETIAGFFNLSHRNLSLQESMTWESLETEREIIRNKKIFFIGDNMLEIPLARFLHNAGARIVEVGVPYIHSIYNSRDLEILQKENIPVFEAPDNFKQLKRIQTIVPDLIISPLSLSYPLEKLGFKTIWSIKFILPDIRGFSNAWRLFNIFTTPLKQGNCNAAVSLSI